METIEIKLKDQKMVLETENGSSYITCPICGQKFQCSDYLKNIFDDEKVLWFANMVTHYRHDHITSWNKCWGYHGRRYREGWFGDYDEEKAMVNERAKRQIIRKCKDFLIKNGFTVDHLLQLQNTTSETIALANKLLKTKTNV